MPCETQGYLSLVTYDLLLAVLVTCDLVTWYLLLAVLVTGNLLLPACCFGDW